MPIHLPSISRRRFLRGAAATAGALALRPDWVLAETAQPNVDPNRLALLSDTHIDANITTVAREVNMWDHLQRVTREVLALSPRPAALLVNGDCAYSRGERGDYATIIKALSPIRERGIPAHLAFGNHDNRANLMEALPEDDRRVNAVENRCMLVVRTPHADWYMLDSLERTNHTPGTLGEDQLKWLASSLDAAGADRPAVVSAHHQPDLRLPEQVSGLTDTAALLDVLKPRKQVKALMFGHTHAWTHREEDGLHFVNLPATAYVFRPEPSGWVDAQFSEQGVTLKLSAITPNHPKHGDTLKLKWR